MNIIAISDAFNDIEYIYIYRFDLIRFEIKLSS